MSNGDPLGPDIFHWLWNGLLTLIAGLGAVLGKRVLKDIDDKLAVIATKADLSDIQDLRQSISDLRRENGTRHHENTARLDAILMHMNRRQ